MPTAPIARRAAILLAVLLAVFAAAPAPAWAGGTLTGGDPADGAALSGAPARITLTFTARPDPALSHVSVRDAAQREVTAGDAGRDSAHELQVPVRITTNGNYLVAFHVVFTDGSETIGARSFSVGTGVPPPSAAGAPIPAHQHDIDPASAVLLVLDLLVALGVVGLLILRPRRRADHPTATGP